MRIGIFGGSFNPPHKMHLKIAQELLNKEYIDKVIFVPTGSKYKYKNNLVQDKHRLKMLKIMTKNDKRLLVSNYEFKDKVVYTYETLAYFQDKYKKDELYFICGADNLSYIDEWKNGLEILKNYKILVIDRKSNDVNKILKRFSAYRKNIILTSVALCEISSTNIRALISSEQVDELVKLVDKNVLEYMIKKNLYRNK